MMPDIMTKSIIEQIAVEEEWLTYIRAIAHEECNVEYLEKVKKFVKEKCYETISKEVLKGDFVSFVPARMIIIKKGTDRKRTVYKFDSDALIVLKFINWKMLKYDLHFALEHG